ncbi:MAG: sxtJ [Coleofasciculaceae cyanobacterium SM2_1_6]|nr:sxtJ [Coleofasciculaceae cyanobacterium SM2_1_6]
MHEIPKLDRQGLRNFGLMMAGFLGVIFGVIIPLVRRHESPSWIWAIASLFVAFALIAPNLLNPVYHVWMRFGMALGWVETRIVLGLVFYLMIFPMGLVMRLLSNDPLRRELQKREPSYRVPSKLRNKESLERPF